MKQQQNVRKYGVLIYATERLFAFLLQMSPSTWFLSTRANSQIAFQSDKQKAKVSAWLRANRIEIYVLIWLALLISCVLLAFISCNFIRILVTFLSLYRVFDIVVAAVNITLLDRLRLGRGIHYVSSVERSLILSLWNFLEIILCFGIVYSASIDYLESSKGIFDAYYFSVITQLTIGYGDLLPRSHLKLVSMTQGLIGLLFALLVLGRFVSLLPRIKSLSDTQ